MARIPRFCSIDGCTERHRSSGLCQHHYNVSRYDAIRAPTPEIVVGIYTTRDIEHFWRRVRKGPDCWDWIGQPSQAYPEAFSRRIAGTRVRVNAHVMSYQINVGPIPEDKPFICHTCDHTRCPRPDHLFPGTAADNMHDMITKGRQKWVGALNPARGPANGARLHPELLPRGERHGMAILTEEQVLEIRSHGAHDRRSTAALAASFHVSPHTIAAILSGRLWKHLL